MFLCCKGFEIVRVGSSTLLAELSFWHIFLPCTSRSRGLFTFARIACLLQLWIKTSDLENSIWVTPKQLHEIRQRKEKKNCFQEDPFLKIQRSRRERWRSEEIYGTYLLIFHCLAKTTGSFFQPFLCFLHFFHSKKYCSEHQIIFTREVWFH